eukprot:6039896-Amphidinium_carterae.1
MTLEDRVHTLEGEVTQLTASRDEMQMKLQAYENSASLLFRIMSQAEITARVTREVCARMPPGQPLPLGFETTLNRTIHAFSEEVTSQAVNDTGDSVLLNAVEAMMQNRGDVPSTQPLPVGEHVSNASFLL